MYNIHCNEVVSIMNMYILFENEYINDIVAKNKLFMARRAIPMIAFPRVRTIYIYI